MKSPLQSLVLRIAIPMVAVAGSFLYAADADAHRGRFRSNVGIYFGVPGPFFYHPYAYYPRYYYPPVYAPAPAYYPPTTYIEQPAASAPPPQSAPAQSAGYWYYCRETQTYYPYVQQCASPWQQVVPNSAPPS